jgi:hypothetical protein
MHKENLQQLTATETPPGLLSGRSHDPNRSNKVSLIYLLSVPFLTLLLGFGIGHVARQLYLPAWLLNTLMWRSLCAGC